MRAAWNNTNPGSDLNYVLASLCLFSVSLLRVAKGRGGGGGGARPRFMENKTVLSQFTKNKMGTSCFTETKENAFL